MAPAASAFCSSFSGVAGGSTRWFGGVGLVVRQAARPPSMSSGLSARKPVPVREQLPEWAARVGAEVRNHAAQLPTNEPYRVDVTELLQVIRESEPKPQPKRQSEGSK